MQRLPRDREKVEQGMSAWKDWREKIGEEVTKIGDASVRENGDAVCDVRKKSPCRSRLGLQGERKKHFPPLDYKLAPSLIPPSTVMICPVTHLTAGSATAAIQAATSSGVPRLYNGTAV
jgi:hypothetical protein